MGDSPRSARYEDGAPLAPAHPSPETLDLLAARRSTKWFLLKAPGPKPAELREILAIASRVPDHGKIAPWRFIMIEGEARLELGRRAGDILAAHQPDLPPERLALERDRFAHVPVTVAVVSCVKEQHKIPVWEQQLSAGAVCMNLLIAASAMGYAGAWITEWLAFDSEALSLLGLKPGERLAGLVGLGSADEVQERGRPDLDSLLTRWRAP